MRRAVNPETGEVLFLVNNQWTPPSRTARNPETGQFAYLVNNEWQIADPFKPQQKEEEGFFDRFLEAAKPEALTREVLDVPLKFSEGVVTTSRAITEAFGANNELAQSLRGVEDYLAGLASAQSKQDSAEISRIMKEAEDAGLGEQLRSALKAFTVAPIDFLSQAAGSTVPVLLGAVAGTPGVLTTAALTGAGVVKGTIYDTVKEELKNAGVPEREAEARAQLAQEYGGENLDMILGGTALGVVAGRFGVEKYILGKIAAKEAAKDIAEKGVARQAIETGVTEAVPEAIQAGQEQLAANIALQREGFDVPTLRGVAGQAALEAIAGGALGATVGGVGAARPSEAPPAAEPEVELAVEPEGVTEPIAPTPTAATPIAPTADILGGYVNEPDQTETRIVSSPDGRFQVVLVDTETGQTSEAGIFDDFDSANALAAQLVGVTPQAPTPPAIPAEEPPTIPAAGITPTAPAVETPPTLPAEVTTTIKPPEFSPEEQQALANYFQGQIPDAETIFQNRDRSGKGSIAQMQKIAAAPDYSLVGPSKVLAEGAPVIISDVQIPDRLRGRVDTATASNGQRFPVQYAVVPASELTASNMADGTVNPLYGDMNVPGLRAIAGNGRIAGIQEAYRRKTTEPYVAELMSDTSHGITPEQIASVPNPVLVRIIPKSLVPANIGDLSNVSGIAGLEPVDRAKNDLKRLAGKFDITGLQFTEEGNPQLSTLRQFIQAMPESEQSELINKSTGLPNPDASSRLMNAIFYGAYENDALIDLYAATTNPDAKMYLNSLARVAPKMVKLAGTGDYDIRNKVVEGIENLVSAVRQGVPIKEMPTFVKQGAIGLDPYAQKIMEFIADSGRSTKRIAEGLSRLADASMAASQISQEPDMFGQVPPRPSLDQVFESLKEIELEPDLDLFGTTPTETTPTDETKKPPPPPPPKEAPKETPGKVSMEIKKNAETIFKEIENLDIQGLAQWTIDNAPNEILKEVARKSKQRIDDFAARKIQMDKVILSNARRRKGARGSVRYTSSPAGFKFVLTLNGLVNGKEAPVNGLRYQTILHELIHAATMVQTMNYPKSNENIKALSSLRTLLRKRYREDVANKTLSADLVWKLKFAFQNIDELMAWGMTDKDVQGYLKQVKVGPKFTAFGKLVEIARKILGLGPNSQTALESLLSTTDKLLSSPIQEVEKEIAPGRPPISRISPESPEKMVDEIREQQEDMFGEQVELIDPKKESPKIEVKLPPGRSPELAQLAQMLQSGLATREEYDAAVNQIAPIYVFTSAKQPATTKQIKDALNVVQREKVNAEIPDGSKVGSRLDIDAKRKHDVAVVVIHEPKPTITAPAAKRALSYRSTVVLKNVEFGIGKQENSLDIAAGKKKNSLQTMEGTLVEMSPEEAFKKAERAMKDSDYIQVGFDPIRHSYFYDRVTTIPVIGADEVIQIGDMVLAKNPKFGRKDQFLYNIGDAQGDMFSDQETKALKQTDDVAPSGKKVVTKNRSPELTAAAQQLSRGEITKEEYEAAVQRFSPVSVYAEPPKPASNAQVVEALDANKKKDANVNIESGTKVGLRLDIPAWENKKTWVVAIHEGKPKITSPKADKILSYRSVAGLKNVVFGIGNQAKTLAIAAGEFKDKLQTMEGEYVNISPDEAYRRAQELIKDPAYIQVGFNPLRHAYFYDRRTMLPVVQAEEVLQIGNLILAKNATYGSKDDFLFDINSTPEMTEEQIDTGITESRDEQIAEYARLRARRAKLIQDVIGGGASIEVQRELTNVDALAKALKEDIDATYVPSRSPEMFLKRALEAFDKGEMSAEVLATIQDAYNKTPFILNGLRLSIRTKKDEGSREIGNFSPIGRIVTLWTGTKGTESSGTIRHELTHSLEQMMTPEQRKVIVDAWKKAFLKAVDKNKDPQSRLYFKKVLQFLDTPSKESFAAATAAMPSFEFYQYMNPSEYWAVNAETLMSAQLGTAWNRFVKAVKKLLESLKNVFGFDNKNSIHKVFDQLMKDKPKPMGINALADYVMGTGARPATLSNISQNVFGQPMPEATWGRPDDSKMDDVIYTLQDKMVDTKRVVDEIKKSGKSIADKWNPYLQEELYHGRTATKTTNFLKDELEPLMNEIRKRGLTMAEVEEYLHNRHAQARNEFNAKRDPKMPDGGSGIMTADAKAYLDGLTQKQKRDFEAVAKLVDGIVDGTQKLLVETGQESQATIDAWNKALKNYVPLQREETDYDVKNVGVGVGSGFAVKGPFSRAAVGSSKNVIDILANVAMQRERAIVRGEKMRVAKALYGLVLSNPNPGFWLAFDPEAIKKPAETENELVAMGLNPADAKNLVDQPVMRYVDPATNTVVERPNSLLVNSRTSMPVRINGKEKYIIFNAKDPRAERMAEALKNLDADQLGRALSYVQSFTQYFAKINTQYNPIFGVINFTRDVQGALLQLSTTPLRNEKKAVFAGVGGALRGIYTEERLRRKGEQPSNNSWAKLWEEFQEEGGQTGFRDQFSRSQERAEALQSILDPSSWTKTPLGQVFTVGGALKVPLETARKVAAPVFDWLSDYNQTMENAIRLSAYKVARDKGMTKQQAASLAKNLTVNFNRKGQIGRQAGALYAFFNAAVQGTTRMLETLRGPAGQKIIYGGLLLGSAQAMMLAAFGFDEDEPPEFVKERNIVIPTGGSKYITIPMPLGYNVIPNTSRILTEWTLSGFKNTHKRVADITGAALDMFNPLGNAGWSAQTFLPTVSDPVVALMENKDWTGKPIAKEDMSSLDPTPGYTRSKETASIISKEISKFLNAATGGTDYTPGTFSPTPDQIDFLIGQLTGGVGRELLKAEQTVTSQFTGEELPIYKVPLVGRFIGDSEGQAAERNRFYNNLILLNKHERELKGRIKDRVPTKDYLMEYPEARLYSYANQVERNIRTLKKRRDELIEKGAPKEQVKRVENQMTVQMQRFNERVKARANQ